jgi:stress response protein YsnF
MSDQKRPSGNPRVQLLEERASIHKRTVTIVKVCVVTHTESIEETVRAVLKGEEVEVVTVELDRMVNGPAPLIRTEWPAAGSVDGQLS